MTIGVGTDLVDVERFKEVLERTPKLIDRLFTDGEREYGLSHADSGPPLAVRFAAKEATMKALGVGIGAFDFQDVEVIRGAGGEPTLKLHGAAAELAESKGVTAWKVSLSHTACMANAVVLAE